MNNPVPMHPLVTVTMAVVLVVMIVAMAAVAAIMVMMTAMAAVAITGAIVVVVLPLLLPMLSVWMVLMPAGRPLGPPRVQELREAPNRTQQRMHMERPRVPLSVQMAG